MIKRYAQYDIDRIYDKSHTKYIAYFDNEKPNLLRDNLSQEAFNKFFWL